VDMVDGLCNNREPSGTTHDLHADVTQLRACAALSNTSTNARGAAGGCRIVASGRFRTHQDVVSGISVSDTGIAVTCSWDSCIHAFDLVDWEELSGECLRTNTLAKGGEELLAVATSLCAPQLVGAASVSGRTWLWNMDSGAVHTLEEEQPPGVAVNDVDFHPTQVDVVCTAVDDRRALLWDTSRQTPVRVLRQHSQAVVCAKFLSNSSCNDVSSSSAYERVLATASADQHVRLWDLRAPALQAALPAAADQRVTFAASASNHMLVVGSDHGTLAVWDLRRLRRRYCCSLSTGQQSSREVAVASVALSPCCSFLAAGLSSGAVLIYDLVHQSQQELSPPHDDAVLGLAWGAARPWPWMSNLGLGPVLLCASHDSSWSAWAAPLEPTQVPDGGSKPGGCSHATATGKGSWTQ